MPKFLLSWIKALPFDFEPAVQEFIDAKKHHLTTEGVPAPTAHPTVEAAVRRIPGTVDVPDDFVPDYQIVDDTPDPPSLDERKMLLASKLDSQATSLMHAIVPPLKSHLMNIQVGDAQIVPESQRTDEQKATIADHEARSQKTHAIFRHLAVLKDQIHDLTDATIDTWEPAPFPSGD
jgi:hypothetical protein